MQISDIVNSIEIFPLHIATDINNLISFSCPRQEETIISPKLFPLFLLIPAILLAMPLAAESAPVSGDEIPRGNFTVQADLPLPPDLSLPTLAGHEATFFRQNGELIYRHGEEFMPRLMIGRAEDALRYSREHSGKNNNFAIEILIALDLPPQKRESLNAGGLDLDIFNVLHRISTLTGLQYFSASRGHMREFYRSSAVVDEADNSIVLPDPVFTRLRSSYRFIIRQEDASFGENIYEVRTSPGVMSIRNISPMYYSILRIAEPGDLELQLRIQQTGDYLLFYAFSSMKAPEIFGIQEKVRNSFYNRMVALYNWFAREFEESS